LKVIQDLGEAESSGWGASTPPSESGAGQGKKRHWVCSPLLLESKRKEHEALIRRRAAGTGVGKAGPDGGKEGVAKKRKIGSGLDFL